MSGYAELVAATNFSFLRGASAPADMVGQAIALGLGGIGIADRNTVAGVVRAHVALRHAREKAREVIEAVKDAPATEQTASDRAKAEHALSFRLLVGARLAFADGTPDIIAYPATRYGWGRLTRLLTVGNLRAGKGDCLLTLDDLIDHADDLMLIALAGEGDEAALARLRPACPGRLWLGATMLRRGSDRRRLLRLGAMADRLGLPVIATNDALYATPEDRPLQDVMTCIRDKVGIIDAGRRLQANAERHLKPPAEMARLFRDLPQAIGQTLTLMSRVTFTLDDLRYEYPHEPVPAGWQAQDWLEHLVMEAAHRRYGDVLPDRVREVLNEEFGLIRTQRYAHYFLTVYDLVRFARSCDPPILCQGRGSAANSIVCFLLGVTSVDPIRYDLLFSRFVSEERSEPPDIDVDFEHERREEVIQYIYRRYGRHRAGIAATVIHYRPRSAVREVGKVLGFSEDMTARLVSTIWGSFAGTMEERRYADAGFDPDTPQIARLRDMVDRILMFPRHLSQHVGGFVLTQDRLDETVPIHNAAMPDRTFIEWDKDDIDALGLMKVDVLALGMLTCIRKSFELIRAQGLGDHDLTVDLAADDPQVYAMLCKGDSIGVFQVESRAQINMLPRLLPKSLYDLTVQVAIVRPGPIEGDMVHPYLRRRSGIEAVEYPEPAPPHDPNELRKLLGETYGVPLFQEQAMKLAIVAAGFSKSEANQLRRAMATFRNVGTIHQLREKMVSGMVARGYDPDFAERCFRQIEGFGSYGFPESHALSFARLVYVSAWIKCHHPAIFACALLNSQPMGFYAPAQIVRDARDHAVEVRAVDINHSGWDNAVEPDGRGGLALRIGFRQLDGFRESWADAVVSARGQGRFATMEQLARRANLPARALRLLADADAFGSLGFDRRQALWEARRTPEGELPLFAAAHAPELGVEPALALPAMTRAEQVVADYQTLRLSLKDHPMTFLRPVLQAEGVLSSADIAAAPGGQLARVAGIVLVRQRPGKGNAIFVTLEDETGITNIVIWARRFEAYRRQVMASRLMLAEGEVQRSREGVIHLIAARIHDRTDLLDRLGDQPDPALIRQPAARHPRDVRIMPKSRDFH